MPLTPNQTILNGKYRIVRLIGEGGAARVWLAEDLRLDNRLVAIKELRRDLLTPSDLEEQERRFFQEMRLAALLERANAPHTVRAITVEEMEDGVPLLVMAYADGGSLADLIKAQPHGIPIDQAVRITIQVCEALEALHNLPMGPVHRDVKPANILLTGDGEALLSDFGLAQLPGQTMGRDQLAAGPHPATLQYAAPEQLRGPEPLVAAADLFALGCVIWEMLTGQRYKGARDPNTPPGRLRSDVPARLDDVVMKALATEPWNRWHSAGEMAEALRVGQAEEQARQEAARHAAAEAAERARTEEETRLHKERLATWFAEADRLASTQPDQALVLTAKIRAEDPKYPDLDKIERRAKQAQKKAGDAGNNRSPRLGWVLGGVTLVIAIMLAGSRLVPNLGLVGDPTSTPTATAGQAVADTIATQTLVPRTRTPAPSADTPAFVTDTPAPPTDTPSPATDTHVLQTDTPIRPTYTPMPPTDTPLPPADTLVPPTDTAALVHEVVILSPGVGETISDSSVMVRWSGPSNETDYSYIVAVVEKPRGWEDSRNGENQGTWITGNVKAHEFQFSDFADKAAPGYYNVNLSLMGPDHIVIDFKQTGFEWFPNVTPSPSPSPTSSRVVPSTPFALTDSSVSLAEPLSPANNTVFRGGYHLVKFEWNDQLHQDQEYLLVVDYLLGQERMTFQTEQPSYSWNFYKQGTYRWWVLTMPKGMGDNLETLLTPDNARYFSFTNK